MRPMRELPFVDGTLDRRAAFEVLLREDEEVEHLENAELDIIGVQMLLLHEGEVGTGHTAVRRPGIPATDQGR